MKTYKKIAAVIKAPRDAGESMPSMAKTREQERERERERKKKEEKPGNLLTCNK